MKTLSYRPAPQVRISTPRSQSIPWRPGILFFSMVFFLFPGGPLRAQTEGTSINLTLDRMVDLALNSSFRVRQLNLSIDRTRYRLQAEQARLKSRVDLEVDHPEGRDRSSTFPGVGG